MGVNFLAELSERFDTTILPKPSTIGKDTNAAIYEIDIDVPIQSYWQEYFGGHDDSFVGTQIQLYYGQFLRQQNSLGDLLQTLYTMFITYLNGRRKALMHLPFHPWLYPEYTTSVEHVIPFLSKALDPSNPSNNIVRGEIAETRLEVPNFWVRVSNDISGISLNQGFSVTLWNEDGLLDDDDLLNIFNTPLHLKKTSVENPSYEDFKMIRDGLVESTNTTFSTMEISVADKFRSLQGPVCEAIRQGDFTFDMHANALSRPIPLVFGTVRMGLVRLDDTRYMTAGNAGNVSGVFDRDGYMITGFSFDGNTGILTIPDADIEAREAIVTGRDDNRIGNIIKWLFENRANIFFNDTNFNVEEFDAYAESSFRVNMIMDGGNVRNAIGDVLRNDAAFLVQQTDGRFSLRSYTNRNDYPLHVIESNMLTKRPEKDFSNAQRNYFSSCIVNYVDNTGEVLSELYDERRQQAERAYRRRVERTFDTGLTNKNDARTLAGVLSDRYTSMRQSVRLAVGVDTSGFQLCDRVMVDLTNVNGRGFSGSGEFIITGINHAQDHLELEEI